MHLLNNLIQSAIELTEKRKVKLALCDKMFKITELDDSFLWEDIVELLRAFISLHKIGFTIEPVIFFNRLNAMDCTRLEKFAEICENSLDFTNSIL